MSKIGEVSAATVGLGCDNTLTVDRCEQWVSPLNSVDGAPHGLHGIDTGVLFTQRDASLFFESLDAGLVAWGGAQPFPTPIHSQPNLTEGASFVLWDNLWNVSLCLSHRCELQTLPQLTRRCVAFVDQLSLLVSVRRPWLQPSRHHVPVRNSGARPQK